jgi:hypothetical protein
MSEEKDSGYHVQDLCYKQIEMASSSNSFGAEVKTHKPIAIGYTPSQVGDTQEPTVEDAKDDYVSGEINIVELENKLEEIMEIDE